MNSQAVIDLGEPEAARAGARVEWHMLTGEYPPQSGGVGDYVRLVAQELARRGCGVHVWAPCAFGKTASDTGVVVHRLRGHFGPWALAMLHFQFSRWRYPNTLLVHYVPHLYGWKAMNVWFCLWLSICFRGAYQMMFHEVAYPREPGQPWRRRLLANVNGWMAARLARSAQRVYVSTSSWEPVLRRLAPDCGEITCLPVLSTMALETDNLRVAELRKACAPDATSQIIGHFGTYGDALYPMVSRVLDSLLSANPRRVALLLGKGNVRFAERFVQCHPQLANRLVAPGLLSASEISNHLAACDLLVQPYPDGVTTRRSTVMAALALGLPVVATAGHLTESFWRTAGAVALADVNSLDQFVEISEKLLANQEERRSLGARGREIYERHFSVEQVTSQLCAASPG